MLKNSRVDFAPENWYEWASKLLEIRMVCEKISFPGAQQPDDYDLLLISLFLPAPETTLLMFAVFFLLTARALKGREYI